jgi:hypothetical protein
MPSYPTLLDMAKRNGRDRAVPLIQETSKLTPEISGVTMDGRNLPGVGQVRTIKGINFHTLVRTSNPVVSFRDANTGTTSSASTYENRLVETFILNPRWECDKAVADRSEDGPDAYIADEAMAIMEATMQLLGKQFFYGRTTGDGKGHTGLVDSVISQYTKSAGGTAGQSSSVWFVKFGPTDVQWVYGENGALTIPDKRIETLYRADPGTTTPLKPMTGYVQDMLAYPGVQVSSVRSIARLTNVSAETGHTLTDALLYQTIALMDRQPDVIFMNKILLEQLRESRTTFNPTGAPAPIPTDCQGIPIAPTQSLTMTE